MTIEKALFDELQEKQELSVKVLARALTNPVYQFDMDRILGLLEALTDREETLHAYVYDAKGLIVHDGTKELRLYNKPLNGEVGKKALATRQLASLSEGDTLSVAVPILLQNELLGGVEVAFSLKQIRSDIAKHKDNLISQYQGYQGREFFFIGLAAALFAVVGVLSAFFLARSWSQPIRVLSSLSERIGRGEYELEIPIRRRADEIGQLAGAFEAMTKNLRQLREKETAQASELIAAYEELKNAHDALIKANKGKDEFLSVMSHELRTPLNVIMGYTGMIKEGILGAVNSEQARALEKVIARSSDLLIMINQILQATSIESGKVQLEKQEIPVKTFLEGLRSNYEFPLDKKIALNWDYPVDSLTVETDGAKLKHILQNLINNAIKFTAQGSIDVAARHRPEAEEVEFRVTDTGIGIPEENLTSIFEIFHQVDSSETRNYGGVGIGLYIVKKYTDLLGGKIEVRSALGKGTTFTLTLPRRSPAT